MKNLFDYATKELSQDAFLRWLFESWNCDKQIEVVVKKLLNEFCGLEEEIQEINSIAQDNYIDIRIDVITKSNRAFHLFIEDKAFSSEHHQLSAYDKYINGLNEENYKLFYKTNLLSDADSNGVEQANKENREKGKSQWRIIDIKGVARIFNEGQPYVNMILQDYVNHINKIAEAVNNVEKPLTNSTSIDFLKWEAYFKNKIIPNLKKEGYRAGAWKAGQYPYICLVIKKEGLGDKIPYLEIRSRDCLDNNFNAFILCYGLSNEDFKNQQPQLIANADALIESGQSKLKKGKRVYRKKGKEIYPKQVACTDKIVVENDLSFINLVEELVADYLKIMKDWHS